MGEGNSVDSICLLFPTGRQKNSFSKFNVKYF